MKAQAINFAVTLITAGALQALSSIQVLRDIVNYLGDFYITYLKKTKGGLPAGQCDSAEFIVDGGLIVNSLAPKYVIRTTLLDRYQDSKTFLKKFFPEIKQPVRKSLLQKY
jgi:hypothetical protein